LYFPMILFLIHIPFSREKPAYLLKHCIPRLVPEYQGGGIHA
jgi:hypothetical protein